MKILVIGSGGREHTLVWKLAQSPKVSEIYCAPGNDGIGQIAKLVPLAVEDIDGLVEWAKGEGIGVTVVGPEVPLTMGIVDRFEEAGLAIFGPSRKAAQLEGSKAFAKDLMERYGIPTGVYSVFENSSEAKEYIEKAGVPLVIKADGLAAGKGVVVAHDLETALDAVDHMLELGVSGSKIVIEEFLEGVEVSVLALSDGKTVLALLPAHDHKAAFDGDQGPNTGGMGAFAPSHLPEINQIMEQVQREILQPTIDAMAKEGIPFKGVLFAGLMLTTKGPKVLEFNARFGDPETQVVLPLLENDLVDVIEAVIEERLSEIELTWCEEKCLTVILASGGYPQSYSKGIEIKGLTEKGEDPLKEVTLFHAGTKYVKSQWLTNGGRVLAVTVRGNSFDEARQRAYAAIERIRFDGQHYRRDIGNKAL